MGNTSMGNWRYSQGSNSASTGVNRHGYDAGLWGSDATKIQTKETPTPFTGGVSPTYMDNISNRSYPGSPPGGRPPGRPRGPGGGGGSGGGGLGKVGMEQIMKLLGRKPQQYTYQDQVYNDYEASPYRDFNGAQYDMMRGGISEGLAADRATGAGAYGDARTELSQYQNPFTNRAYTQNQGMPAAMQRMMAANNVSVDPAETRQGMEADRAFGNVLALLGGTADQSQASAMRALGGDERRFNESLSSEGRTMNLGVNMAEAKARELYEQEKWQYGEEVARMNFENRMRVDTANNQGQNQTAQGNVGLTNDYNSSGAQTLIELLAGGQKIDPAAFAAYLGG